MQKEGESKVIVCSVCVRNELRIVMSNRSAEMHMRASRHFFDKYEELKISRHDKNTKYIYPWS